uniref:Uncharacterized protein n=1 Tax=Trichogramma kaykai TaxID=54128 RepID=A0ABD2WBA7_9HYME
MLSAAQLAINVEKFGEKRRKINRRYRRPQLAAAHWLTVIYSNRDHKLQPDISAAACLLTITISTTRVRAHTELSTKIQKQRFLIRPLITTASTTTRTETRTRTTTRRATKRRLMMQQCAKKQSSGHPRRGLLPAADDAPPSPAAGRVPMRRRWRRRLHLSTRRLARPYHHTASESRGFEIATTRAAAQQRRSRRSSFADNPHEHAGAPHKYTYKYISISHTRARTSREFRVGVRS